MVAVGSLRDSGTNTAQTAVPQAGVPLYFVPGDLGPRDATGASEAIGTMTPMDQLLSETLAEFEFDEPVTAKVPGSMCVWRSLKETVKEETVKVETTEEETAEKKTAEKETAVEETAEEEIDWNSEAACAKDAADAAERLNNVTHAAVCTGQRLRLRHQ